MAKKSDIQAQIDALTAQLDDADDDDGDYELWIKNDKGHEARVPSSRADGWLKENFGISLRDEVPPAADPQDPAGPGGGDPKDPKPAGGGYFSKRKS